MRSREFSAKMKSKDSKDFLDEGLTRRLFMLKTTVDSISATYSEWRTKPLDDNEKAVLSQNIKFFYANIYAILDCLAFVFAFEYPNYQVDRHNKKELKKVGLFKKGFREEIKGLSEKLNLTKLERWHDKITDLRDLIAHRIPLYFPEIFNREDDCKNREVDEKYYESFNAILKNMTTPTNDQTNQLRSAREDLQKAKRHINVFSGCFLPSYDEPEKLHHLSRLTLDLGILSYLLDQSFENFCAICG